MSIFKKIKPNDFLEFLIKHEKYFPVDRNRLIDDTYKIIKGNNHGIDIMSDNIVRAIERRWYKSLESGSPDYSVYADPNYIGDIWSCWVMYSRKSVMALNHPNTFLGKNLISYFGTLSTIVDLGCGFGFTTVGLKEIFPKSQVYGTNLENTFQFKIAKSLEPNGIKIVSSYIGKCDLIFASEYFEHIQRPIEHLVDIVNKNNPKFLVIANGFNGHAIGHFNNYLFKNTQMTNREMSKFFLKSLRFLGYRNLKTKIWNNRPSIWEKV